MARSGLFRNHGAFILLSFLVLFGGLYTACSGSAGDDDDKSSDSGKRDDAPSSNRPQ